MAGNHQEVLTIVAEIGHQFRGFIGTNENLENREYGIRLCDYFDIEDGRLISKWDNLLDAERFGGERTKKSVREIRRFSTEEQREYFYPFLRRYARDQIVMFGIAYYKSRSDKIIDPATILSFVRRDNYRGFVSCMLKHSCPVCVYGAQRALSGYINETRYGSLFEGSRSLSDYASQAVGIGSRRMCYWAHQHDVEVPTRTASNSMLSEMYVHDTCLWGHSHFFQYERQRKIFSFGWYWDLDRLEAEVFYDGIILLRRMTTGQAGRPLTLKRFCPFPLPLSTLLVELSGSHAFWVVVNCMWMMGRLCVPPNIKGLKDLVEERPPMEFWTHLLFDRIPIDKDYQFDFSPKSYTLMPMRIEII
jgi:hypothetical protein